MNIVTVLMYHLISLTGKLTKSLYANIHGVILYTMRFDLLNCFCVPFVGTHTGVVVVVIGL